MKQLLSACGIITINVICMRWSNSVTDCLFSTMEHYFNYEILTQVSTSLWGLLLLAHQTFIIINFSLTNIVLKGTLHISSNIISLNYLLGRFNKVPDNKKIPYYETAPETTLKIITKLHFKAVKAANMSSCTYRFQILIILVFTLLRIVENLHYSLNNRVSSIMTIGAELFWLIMIMANLFITFFIATKVEQIVRLVYNQTF